ADPPRGRKLDPEATELVGIRRGGDGAVVALHLDRRARRRVELAEQERAARNLLNLELDLEAAGTERHLARVLPMRGRTAERFLFDRRVGEELGELCVDPAPAERRLREPGDVLRNRIEVRRDPSELSEELVVLILLSFVVHASAFSRSPAPRVSELGQL